MHVFRGRIGRQEVRVFGGEVFFSSCWELLAASIKHVKKVSDKNRRRKVRERTVSKSLKCQTCNLRDGKYLVVPARRNLPIIKLHLGLLSSEQKLVSAYRKIVSLQGLNSDAHVISLERKRLMRSRLGQHSLFIPLPFFSLIISWHSSTCKCIYKPLNDCFHV